MVRGKKLVIVLLLMMSIIPIIKVSASAATKPEAPTGLDLYYSNGSKVMLDWDYDGTLVGMTVPKGVNQPNDYLGYEIMIKTLKGKKIAKIDTTKLSQSRYGRDDNNKIAIKFTNKKLKTQAYQFAVRSFIYDKEGKRVYSEYSAAKIVIPRAYIYKGKALAEKGSARVYWNKVTGAKNYTIYLSRNGGKKFRKFKTTTKNNLKLTGLKEKKNYYVYVQVNGIKVGKNVYSSTIPINKKSNVYKFMVYRKK